MLRRLLPALALLAGCKARPSPAAAPEAPLEHLVAGCEAGSTGDRCALSPGATLSVWLSASVHDPVTLSGAAALGDPEVREAGVLLRLRPEAGAAALRVSVQKEGATEVAQLRLARTATAAAAAFAEARGILRSGEPATALGLLATAGGSDPFVARRAAMLGAYVAAVMLGDQVEAERRLTGIDGGGPLDGEGAALFDYHRGLLHAMAGDRRAALEALEAAERTADRLDLGVLDHVRQLEAIQLLEIGRAREAVRRLEALAERADQLDPRGRADLLNNLASARTIAGEGLDRARRELERALADYTAAEAEADANNARVSLALLELEMGRIAEARAQLAAVAGRELPITAGWRRLLEARVLLASGRLEPACARYERLAEDARRVLWPSLEAHAELGLGACREAQGRTQPALGAYLRAVEALNAASRTVPIDRGTLERMDGHAEAEARLVALHLKLDAPEEAFAAVRRSRRRDLARVARARPPEATGSAERQRWLEALVAYRAARGALDRAALDRWQSTTADLPRHEAELQRLGAEVRVRLRELLGASAAPEPPLPEIAPGELRLVSAPLGGRTVLLGGTSDAVRAWDAGAPELARALASAERLRVISVPSPELSGLLGDRPFAYTADLPPRARASSSRRALVVADPRNDLPHARREGQEVAALLEARGWGVELLLGPAAGRAVIEARLPEVALLHYAGHGQDLRDQSWDGALLLADGALEVADVVAAAAVPPWVVLSGCQTAVLGRGDLTIAQAFVIGGAEAVVATSTVVDDALARAYARGLYDAPPERWSLEEAHAKARRPGDAFRLLVR